MRGEFEYTVISKIRAAFGECLARSFRLSGDMYPDKIRDE